MAKKKRTIRQDNGQTDPAELNNQIPAKTQTSEFPLVGIGASAGGLAALKKFFAHVPNDSGFAFVIVVHLSPEHKSHLAELLQPHCRIPIQQVVETVSLEKNHAYIIPPNSNLDSIDTHLRLTELEERRQERAPIDHFFRTLAKSHDGNSVGIILTGTGSDGTLGLKDIKQSGGLTVVQDPNEAEYDGMPQSAIATGIIDLVLPVEKIPEAIMRFDRVQPQLPELTESEEPDHEFRRLLQKIFAQLRARTDRDFSQYKSSTILRRIQRRMQLHEIEETSRYLDLLRDQPDEVAILADDLLITVTSFFRDHEAFQKLEEIIIPRLFDESASSNEIRVWSVGCATGEEAYSLAILLAEEASRRDVVPRQQVFASDLHEHSLKRARDGFYSGDIETDVSPERLKRFFVKENTGYRIRKEIREMVVFAPHNLLGDPPFSRISLVACRNLLIYIQRTVQADIIELFHYALRPDGYLVLGTSETVDTSELFGVIDKKTCIYQKRNVPSAEPRLPVFPLAQGRQSRTREDREHRGEPFAYGEMHQQLVEQFAPPSLLVSPDDKVIHFSEHVGRYLVHPGGEPTTSVYKLVREELRIELRAALPSVRETKSLFKSKPILVKFNGDSSPVILHLRAALEPQQAGFVLIIFDETAPDEIDASIASKTNKEGKRRGHATDRVRERELEAEIELGRQRLQAIIEEYETAQEEMKASNEEMQSTNEELRSTMEELETSKEELQSMNEELQTVNQENRHKVEELAQLSSDLQNLLTATDIATLFLDRELRILRFTPRVVELFNIRTTDRGRPISDLTHRLGYQNLQEDAKEVLARLVPIEREVDDAKGRWFLTRVMPYRSTADRIEGVVITLVDITARKAVEDEVRDARLRLAAELAAMTGLHELVGRLMVLPDFRTALDEVLVAAIEITGAQKGAVQLRLPDADALEVVSSRGFNHHVLEHVRVLHPNDDSVCGRAVQSGVRVIVEDVEADSASSTDRDAGTQAEYRGVQATPLTSRSGESLGVLSTYYAEPYRPIARDIKLLDLYARQAADFVEHTRHRDEARIASQRKDEFIAMLAHELRNPLTPICAALEVMNLAQDKLAAFQNMQGILQRQTRQLTRLIDDLLDISRITRGKLELKKRRVKLADVIQTAIEESKNALEFGKHEFKLIGPDKSLELDADPHRLTQIISNLLNNAAKFTPHHGLISLSVEEEQESVVIKVTDNGAGIPAEMLHRIFDLFTQINPNNNGGENGMGVGLALVKSLVEMHGGKITAFSEGAGCGSQFVVRLPLAKQRGAPQPDRADRVEIDGEKIADASYRVLLADDNRDAAEMLNRLLQLMGHEVKVATDGVQAVQTADQYRPDIILMELGMPNMNGYEAARRIRQFEWSRKVVLIALTGWGHDEDRVRSKDAGFDYHMVKGADLSDLQSLFTKLKESR